VKEGGGRRIPKRSVIGSRVGVVGSDGIWRVATIASMKTGLDKKFSVRLENVEGLVEMVEEVGEGEMVGPGFLPCLPQGTILRSGQEVFVTHGGREIEGRVISKSGHQDLVEVEAKEVGTIMKKLEDIRLMESRKSARLLNSDTDFSRLADFNIVEARRLVQQKPSRRRLHSMSDFHDRKNQRLEQEKKEKKRMKSERGNSSNFEVPVAELGSVSRKRRTSESRAELDSGYASSYGSGLLRGGEESMKECTAALVLMNLSVSPRERWNDGGSFSSSASPPSNGHSSPSTPRNSPCSSLSLLPQETEPCKRSRRSSVMLECTWRGCRRREETVEDIERHVREHLGKAEPEDGEERDYEEEFYYTELEEDEDFGMERRGIDIVQRKEEVTEYIGPSSSLPTSALGDHIGMARPWAEAPTTIYVVNNSLPSPSFLSIPYSIQGKKLVSIVPKPEPEETISSQPVIFRSIGGEKRNDKKCRKVYGIEQRDSWCTQCKWKKACGRFAQT